MKRFIIIIIFAIALCFCKNGEEKPKTPQPECDTTTGVGCKTGEICINGKCYPQCTTDLDCSRREMCLNGICISKDGGLEDTIDIGGDLSQIYDTIDGDNIDISLDTPPDITNDDTSQITECMSDEDCSDPATPLCHSQWHICVQCENNGGRGCGDNLNSLCDIARGVCVVSRGDFCAPCSNNSCAQGLECIDLDLTPLGTNLHESICTMRCQVNVDPSPCPQGSQCIRLGLDSFCYPSNNFSLSCTTWYLTKTAQQCNTPTDCIPYGSNASRALCILDRELNTNVCSYTCNVETDCPPQYTCNQSNQCIYNGPARP